jgi:site-specific recombinase XerD
MDIPLSELIERAKDSIRAFEHSPSTIRQYRLAWQALADYFLEHDQAQFSRPLAEQYLRESKAKLVAGMIKPWRHYLHHRTVHLLLECFETGEVSWRHYEDPPVYLHQAAYLCLLADYLSHLQAEGKGAGTLQSYRLVSRQFLEFLEQKEVKEIAAVGASEISAFIPFISKQYQPATMRTVLSALRCFLRYLEAKELTAGCLRQALPASGRSTTPVVPTLTLAEEQHLLAAAEPQRATAIGKRNYAMLLLALRLGLRSIDIIHLKREDIHWQSNTLEIAQAKTGARLVLPLLTEVGNALADYLLQGRPPSPLPYVFLRSPAPHRQLAHSSICYEISRTLMVKAGIRQGEEARKGFHLLRHTVAARLLAGGTPLPLISSLLGHQDKNSTQTYLSTDLEHLRACALRLNGIEVTREELQ